MVPWPLAWCAQKERKSKGSRSQSRTSDVDVLGRMICTGRSADSAITSTNRARGMNLRDLKAKFSAVEIKGFGLFLRERGEKKDSCENRNWGGGGSGPRAQQEFIFATFIVDFCLPF
jgi:hypothetical protein